MKLNSHNATLRKRCARVSPYFWVGVEGGKVREIFLYQKIILFASKKPYSCRNT
ncbi:hypothetical protein [Leptospira weilii]|uniref:hypothetical protein n=1 Tax=Leptospira weilii TaxID=28184 RepID=UPI001F3EFA67|nr:hypothetical protein [Leptospira weilii]